MATWYLGRALAISQGQGFTIGTEPTAYYPVGYSAFLAVPLAAFGTGPSAVRLATALLSWLSLVLVYAIARRESEATGRIALAFMALYPNQTAYSSIPHPEVLFQFLVLLSSLLWVLGRSGQNGLRERAFLAGAGLCFGVATLTKPTAFLIPAVFSLFNGDFCRAKASRSILRLAVVYGFMITVVAPWTLRNFLVSGVPIPVSTNLGVNLCIGIGGSLDPADRPESWDAPGIQGELLRDREYRAMAWHTLAGNPLAALGRIPGKLAALYARDDDGVRYHAGVIHAWPMGSVLFRIGTLGAQGWYYCVVALFLWGVCRRVWEFWPPWSSELSGMVFGMICHCSILYGVIFFGAPRFHFVLIPWLVIAAAKAVETVLGWQLKVTKIRPR